MKIINYPAMASPQAIYLIDCVLRNMLSPQATILDPFCGTGRLLSIPRSRGHNVTGIDCSPIAILAARVAHHPISKKIITRAIEQVTNRANDLVINYKPTDNELFWFPENVLSKLCQLLFSIESFNYSKILQRALWLILADTSRRVSYAREEEYKLHRMKEEKRETWHPNVFCVFSDSANTLLERLTILKSLTMFGHFRFHQGDFGALYKQFAKNGFDAIITSPPYGDSKSTVGYGQFAMLPLMILGKSQLFNKEFNFSIGENLDMSCLGGTKCFTLNHSVEIPENVKEFSASAMRRFSQDYFVRLSMLVEILKKDGVISLILGDRISNGQRYPLIDSTSSFLSKNGLKEIFRHDRFLTHKRLPRTMRHCYKNDAKLHNGINYETILCFQK